MSDSLVAPWTATRQAPLSMGFPRQEYWSRLLFPSPGDLPYPGIEPSWIIDWFFIREPHGKPSQTSVQSLSHLRLCDPMNRSTPGLPVHHQLPESTQTHVHWVGDAIQPSRLQLSPSPPAPNPSQHQGLFQWVNSLHEVAKILEFQLQHQSFQWTPRTDLL